MSAIKRGKIFTTKRVDLGQVVPLKVPFSVQIDICSACNLKCNFCVHSDNKAVNDAGVKWGLMSYELFAKIVDDMKASWGNQQIKKLRLFKIGEPLLHPDVCRMIAYAKEANIAEKIEITTNGTLLTEKMSDELIKAGLDILNISINGINEQQYQQTCQYNMKFDEFRKQIAYFFHNRGECKVFLKYSDIGYSESEKKEFYHLFEDICDEIFVETISATLWQDTNIANNVVNAHIGTYGQLLEEKKVCPFLFTTMIINDQGHVHMCCVDWKMKYVLGDLNKESIDSIWRGDKLKEYQMLHLKGMKNNIELCENCESLSANTIDNIDSQADEILSRLV